MRRRFSFFYLSLFISGTLVSAVHAEVTMDQVREEIQKELGALPKPSASASVFNPAMGLVLDAVAGHTTAHHGDFDFRSAELNLQAAVDPFANLYAVLNGTPDGVEVEEAFFMTTSLPGLTIRGGRMFANFGRLGHWHDHELPFVNRVPSLDRFIGGESQSDGVEVMHLFKTPFFLQGTLGAYNKIGADNDRLRANTGDGATRGRSWNAFTYLARLFSYVPIGDNFGLDLGVSEAATPREPFINGQQVDASNTGRSLTGLDVTFRFEPLAENVYRKLIWGSELFRNSERRESLDASGNPLYLRKNAWGGYSYVDWRFARQFSAGPFYDVADDLDNPSIKTRTVGGTLNMYTSEFQRIRLQISQGYTNDQKVDNQFFLQYFATIGTHVHVFKDR
jgi:hypothetical protein